VTDAERDIFDKQRAPQTYYDTVTGLKSELGPQVPFFLSGGWRAHELMIHLPPRQAKLAKSCDPSAHAVAADGEDDSGEDDDDDEEEGDDDEDEEDEEEEGESDDDDDGDESPGDGDAGQGEKGPDTEAAQLKLDAAKEALRAARKTNKLKVKAERKEARTQKLKKKDKEKLIKRSKKVHPQK
jgi:hypothetical protein